jgi:hypothetical protein
MTLADPLYTLHAYIRLACDAGDLLRARHHGQAQRSGSRRQAR